jgi:glycosyltransferase involved in cell wall biosynthesis
MRIVHVVPTLEQEASGPSYCVPRLAQSLGDLGHSVRILSVGGRGAVSDSPNVSYASFPKDWPSTPVLKQLWFSRGLDRALDEEAQTADLFHNNSLWVAPNLYPGRVAARHDKPLVVSLHGTLSAVSLSFSPWRKRVFWELLQGKAVKGAACLHATCESEYQDIRKFGLRNPVIILPYGLDVQPPPPPQPARRLRRLLFLGRIHPIKGLDNLLAAWALLSKRMPDWELRLVGPAEGGYEERLKEQARDLPRISFAGPRYGKDKAAEYADADLYVLPSRSENFAVTIGEALAAGTPVLTTTGTPWSGLVREGCGWWVEPTATAITAALEDALGSSPDRLSEMGRRGRAWIERDFSWDRIGAEMAEGYRWAVGGGPVPDCVRLD